MRIERFDVKNYTSKKKLNAPIKILISTSTNFYEQRKQSQYCYESPLEDGACKWLATALSSLTIISTFLPVRSSVIQSTTSFIAKTMTCLYHSGLCSVVPKAKLRSINIQALLFNNTVGQNNRCTLYIVSVLHVSPYVSRGR